MLTKLLQYGALSLDVRARESDLRLPLLPQKTDLGIYSREDEPKLDKRISQLVGQNIATLKTLARKLFLRFGKSFTDVE